jgi:hypothetical protein
VLFDDLTVLVCRRLDPDGPPPIPAEDGGLRMEEGSTNAER